jgi:MSHA biogenesis protein MshQ
VHQHLLYCKFVLRFLVGLCWAILGLAVAPVQAQTYAYRNDVFAYDTPSGTASSVTWHASGASPGCTGYPNGDDDWADVALPGGFTFTFGGVAYSSVRVYSNGILAYGADVSGFHRDYTSQALPIIAAAGGAPAGCPNAVPQRLMLPYWLDIVAGTANSTAGASVQYELLGTAPNRRFVISWVNVKLYNTATRYNFQVQLLESTAGVNGNFRYQYTTGSSTGSGATVGVQLTTTDFTQYAFNQNFIDTTVGTAVLWYPANQLAAKGAEYRFDESAWTGVAGEIKDTSGNIQHASRVGLAASVAPPPAFPGGKLCRGGSFPLNTLNTTIGAVATPITPGNQGSIDFWFNSNVAWNAGGSVAMLLDATTVANRPFFLMKSAAGALTFRLTDSAGTSVTATAPVRTFAANTWHHVGIAWNVRVGTNQTVLQIFLDGALQNGVPTRGTTNGIMPGLSSFHVGDNRTSGITPTGGTPNSANGSIDEVYIYGVEITMAPPPAALRAPISPSKRTTPHTPCSHWRAPA